MVEEQPEFVQRTLQYLSQSHYLFVAMLLAEKGYEFNRNRIREEFLAIALESESSDIRDTYRDYLVGKLSFEDMKQVLESSKQQNNYRGMSVLAIALLWDIEEAVKRKQRSNFNLEMTIIINYMNFCTGVLIRKVRWNKCWKIFYPTVYRRRNLFIIQLNKLLGTVRRKIRQKKHLFVYL